MANVHRAVVFGNRAVVVGTCFCAECRNNKLQELSNVNSEILMHMFKTVLPLQVQLTTEQLYKRTLDTVVAGKACKISVLRNSRYKYLKTHFKKTENFSDIEAAKLADSINECVRVFDNWERIQQNLVRCRLIDQKRLSVNQLNRAYDFAWCLNYEESIRQRTKKPDPPLYSDDKYEDIKQYIKQSGILEDVDYDPKCITAICSRLQRELVFNPR